MGDTQADIDDLVVLTLPADSAYLSVLRTATAALAARLDFTVDEIEDLRIAVDEASAVLLTGAPHGAELTCRFALDTALIGVSVTVPGHHVDLPARDSFAWTVLSALVTEVDATTGVSGDTSIELRKRRGEQS